MQGVEIDLPGQCPEGEDSRVSVVEEEEDDLHPGMVDMTGEVLLDSETTEVEVAEEDLEGEEIETLEGVEVVVDHHHRMEDIDLHLIQVGDSDLEAADFGIIRDLREEEEDLKVEGLMDFQGMEVVEVGVEEEEVDIWTMDLHPEIVDLTGVPREGCRRWTFIRMTDGLHQCPVGPDTEVDLQLIDISQGKILIMLYSVEFLTIKNFPHKFPKFQRKS